MHACSSLLHVLHDPPISSFFIQIIFGEMKRAVFFIVTAVKTSDLTIFGEVYKL
jgi:hypothetical protein